MDNRHHSDLSDCERLRELLPAYSIGAADPDEIRFVEATLPVLPEVAPELKEYAQASQLLYGRVPRAQRPAGMHERFMARVRAEEAAAHPSNIITMPASASAPVPTIPRAEIPRKSDRRLIWLGLVAASLVLFSNVYWLLRLNNERSVQDELNRQNQIIAAILTGTHQTVALSGNDFNATVVWSPTKSEAVLFSENMPLLSEDKTYQLWLIQDDTPLDAGIFAIDDEGRAQFIFEPSLPITDVDAIAISTERAGGSPTPTNPVAIGQVQES